MNRNKSKPGSGVNTFREKVIFLISIGVLRLNDAERHVLFLKVFKPVNGYGQLMKHDLEWLSHEQSCVFNLIESG